MDKKITALQVQKKNPNRVNVYLDGEFAFGLARITAAWLAVGQTLSARKVEELLKADSVEVAMQRALHLLSYRPRSEKEVTDHLRKHETPEAVIDQVVDRLKQTRMVDDDRFARLWADNRSDFRPRGRFALRSELRQKGVPEGAIEQALVGLDEDRLAYQAAQAKARKLAAADEFDFKKKMYGFLTRRGFSHDTITEVVAALWQEIHAAE